jgi:hypothetical protein
MRIMSKYVPLLLLFMGSVVAAADERPVLHDVYGREIWTPQRGRISYPPGAPAPSQMSVSAATAVVAPAAATPVPSGVDHELFPDWYRSVLGNNIGWTGLHVADIDGNGQMDIVAGGGGPFGQFPENRYWYVLSRSGSGFVQRFTNFPYRDLTDTLTFSSLQVGQVDNDPQLEIIIAVGVSIQIHDGRTLEGERSFGLVDDARDITVADVDADGTVEVVCIAPGGLYVYDAATGDLEYRDAAHGGQALAVGQLDADNALELVVGRDDGTIAADAGFVIDGLTHAVEWEKADGFGHFVRTGDVDGDGRDEIVAGFKSGTGIQVYNGDTRALAWSVPVFDLGAVRVLDVEQDGSPEVVYGDDQWGGLHVLAGHNGAEKWGFDTQDPGVTDIAMGDVDGDGVSELLWGTGHRSTGPDYLHVVDPIARVREWRSVDVTGPFYALDSGDVDADGSVELLHAALGRDTGSGAEAYYVHDGATRALEFESPAYGINASVSVWRLHSANVDADPQREIFVAMNRPQEGTIVCRDGITHEEQWRTPPVPFATIVSFQIADADGDGSLELVMGAEVRAFGADGVYVYVYDAQTGAFEWQSPRLWPYGWPGLLRVADVTGNATPEVLLATSGFDTADQSHFWILDGATGALLRTVDGRGITSLDTPDRDGNGKAEVVIGTLAGALQVLDAATGNVAETVGTYGQPIYGLTVKDVAGPDARPEYVYARANQLRLLREAGGYEVTFTRPRGTDMGRHDSLMIANLDADARPEIVVNIGPTGFLLFDATFNDSTPPSVAVTAPAAGASLAGTVTVSATATDGELNAIARVDFLVDGVLLGSDDTAPYELAWNTTAYAGARVLTARAYDDMGNGGTSPGVTVNVQDAVPPSVSFETLRDGALLQGTVEVGILASDNVGVTRVDLLVDGAVVGSDTSVPFSVSLDTRAHEGSRQVVARAFDAAGLFANTASIAVGMDNTPPTVAITSPAAGSSVSGTVTITADADDSFGLRRVEFTVDGVPLGMDDTPPSFQTTWNTAASGPGDHVLVAMALDRAGHRTESAPVTVTVVDTPPAVSLTAPAFGAMFRANVSMSATASDNIAVSRVEFHVDGVLRATDTTAPYSGLWNTTGAVTGNHAVVAKAFDAVGNETATAPVWITFDNVPPMVAIDDPANGSTVNGTYAVIAAATDELSVARVDFLVDGVQKASDSSAPFTFAWPTTSYANGTHALSARATDRAGNTRLSPTATVAVNNSAGGGTASYDATLKAPRCAPGLSSCDSGTLLLGRGTLGPEAGAPNTVRSICGDSNTGSYRVDESVERIVVSTLDGSPLGIGKRVRIDVTVWAWAGFMTDRLDLYITGNPAIAGNTLSSWAHIGTLAPAGPGLQLLSAEYTLGGGFTQAVRARFRHGGSAAVCLATAHADHDDLVFGVQ